MTKGNVSVGATKRYYLSQFSFDDGDREIVFNIVGFNTGGTEITVAISREGKISVQSFDLKADKHGCLYFEYGQFFNRIELNGFECTGGRAE